MESNDSVRHPAKIRAAFTSSIAVQSGSPGCRMACRLASAAVFFTMGVGVISFGLVYGLQPLVQSVPVASSGQPLPAHPSSEPPTLPDAPPPQLVMHDTPRPPSPSGLPTSTPPLAPSPPAPHPERPQPSSSTLVSRRAPPADQPPILSPPPPSPPQPARPPPSPLSTLPSTATPKDRIVDAFHRNGWLAKVTGCHGQFCYGGQVREKAWSWINNATVDTTLPPRVDNDCGPHCAAFSYLNDQVPVKPFSWFGYMSGIMLIYDANPDVWAHVQCMGVTDSFTSARVCCTCHDRQNCPWQDWPQPDNVYCPGACTDDTCRQLAAGCGVSVFDLTGRANTGWRVGQQGQTDWGTDTCTRDQVVTGQCNACTVPYWCDDDGGVTNGIGGYYGRVRNATQWVDAFFDRDGGDQYGSRQCRMKPTQKQLFVDSIRLRFQRREQTVQNPDRDHANVWNEVNAYVDSDQVLAQTLWDNLLGVVYLRTSGDDFDLRAIHTLTAHWRSLGYDVPMFRLSTEPLDGRIVSWAYNQSVNLLGDPYNLEEISPDTET